ncbi:hypothetical protein ABFP37_07685 [Burkholderia sp. RS01]
MAAAVAVMAVTVSAIRSGIVMRVGTYGRFVALWGPVHARPAPGT